MCLVVKRQMRRMCWLLKVAKRMFLANRKWTRARYLSSTSARSRPGASRGYLCLLPGSAPGLDQPGITLHGRELLGMDKGLHKSEEMTCSNEFLISDLDSFVQHFPRSNGIE